MIMYVRMQTCMGDTPAFICVFVYVHTYMCVSACFGVYISRFVFVYLYMYGASATQTANTNDSLSQTQISVHVCVHT